ncbi:MAG: RES family NAD+ phosphorylase, partial [Chthoniobacterales bacterium]
NWRTSPPEPANLAIGDEWAKARGSLILAVPSAIIPEEVNFLLNPAHPDFRRVKIPKPVPFHFDPRLVGR